MPGGAKAVIRETETDGIHLFPCPTPLGPSRSAPGRPGKSTPGPASGRLRSWRRESIFLHPPALWTFVTFGGSYQSADVTRNVCRDAGQIALSISDACSAAPLVPPFPSSIVALPPPRFRCDLMELSVHPRQHVPLIFHSRIYQLLSGWCYIAG